MVSENRVKEIALLSGAFFLTLHFRDKNLPDYVEKDLYKEIEKAIRKAVIEERHVRDCLDPGIPLDKEPLLGLDLSPSRQ